MTADRLPRTPSEVAILTGGGDRPYALGLAFCLIAEGIRFDFIGSDEVAAEDLERSPQVRVFNLRGDVRPSAALVTKAIRIMRYYIRLLMYAAAAKPRIFHILWNNKVELFDRTALLLYYRLLGKRIVLTVHNVNVGKRDGNDNLVNRWSLKIQYRLAHHLFAHTEKMRQELLADFGVSAPRVSVIPFGINDTIPQTALSRDESRARLGLERSHKVILFFGNIAPYKGLEYLVEGFSHVAARIQDSRLIIAGRTKGSESYWENVRRRIDELQIGGKVVQRIGYVPDDEAEMYFKAADVLILPYTHVFQSGVLFLAYSFGLPVIAADVGSLSEEIIAGETGLTFAARDSEDLARRIEEYFDSDLYEALESRRVLIRRFAVERYSWAKVGAACKAIYTELGAH